MYIREKGGSLHLTASVTVGKISGVRVLRRAWVRAGEFMLARYREVVETVLRFRDSKEKLIRRAVIALIPRLAAFAPERFAATYLRVCSEHLLGVLRYSWVLKRAPVLHV